MSVSPKTRCIVWGRAAGRCQFPGCNKLLIGDLVAGNDTMNTAYVAHIVAETPGGPRGDPIRSPLLEDDPTNLMLMCDPHHRAIDREQLASYPEQRLLDIKHDCETRIELATAISQDRRSQIVRYAAKIGGNESVVAIAKCKQAIIETHYPASRDPIDLSMAGVNLADNDPEYFPLQVQNLRRQFDAKINGRLETQDIEHLSVFGLAPIPLLIELGRLLSDITPASIYQLHREPPGWQWARDERPVKYQTKVPDNEHALVALKIAISAQIDDERVFSVLGDDVSVWEVSTDNPHNDIVRQPEDLVEFRRHLRLVLQAIKNRHGEQTVICLFPAVPASVAIEFGRVWMPKADLQIRIFDESRDDSGFVERHLLG